MQVQKPGRREPVPAEVPEPLQEVSAQVHLRGQRSQRIEPGRALVAELRIVQQLVDRAGQPDDVAGIVQTVGVKHHGDRLRDLGDLGQ